MKEYKRIFRSGNDNVPDDHRYNLCEFDIMAGGITPKAQPIDAFLGKVFKGLYRYYYYYYMLYAPSNNRGQPVTRTHQLCATWVVKAWNKVSEELVRKS